MATNAQNYASVDQYQTPKPPTGGYTSVPSGGYAAVAPASGYTDYSKGGYTGYPGGTAGGGAQATQASVAPRAQQASAPPIDPLAFDPNMDQAYHPAFDAGYTTPATQPSAQSIMDQSIANGAVFDANGERIGSGGVAGQIGDGNVAPTYRDWTTGQDLTPEQGRANLTQNYTDQALANWQQIVGAGGRDDPTARDAYVAQELARMQRQTADSQKEQGFSVADNPWMQLPEAPNRGMSPEDAVAQGYMSQATADRLAEERANGTANGGYNMDGTYTGPPLDGPGGGDANGGGVDLGGDTYVPPWEQAGANSPAPDASEGLRPNMDETDPDHDLRSFQITPGDMLDRFKLAQQQYGTFASSTDPQYQAALRDANRAAAATGRLGSGMLRTSYGDLANTRMGALANERDSLFQNALLGSVNDAQTQFEDLMKEQAYQTGAQNQSFNQAITAQQLQEQLTSGEFNRALAQMIQGNQGNPGDMQLKLSEIFGNQSSAAGQAIAQMLQGLAAGQDQTATMKLLQQMAQGGGGIGGTPTAQKPTSVSTPQQTLPPVAPNTTTETTPAYSPWTDPKYAT